MDEDTLVVFTGEQRIYFLSVSQKNIIWQVPRSRQLNSSGNIKCCQLPGTKKIACIARGKHGFKEYFLLVADYTQKSCSIQYLPNCYSVIESLIWAEPIGLSFLTYQAKGDGCTCLYRINGITNNGECQIIGEWESRNSMEAYSGGYIFVKDYNIQEAHLSMQHIIFQQEKNGVSFGVASQLQVPHFYIKTVGKIKANLPKVSWMDEKSGLLTLHTADWAGIYDFRNQRLLWESNHEFIYCSAVIDEKIWVGCASGLWYEEFHERNLKNELDSF